MTTQLSSLGSLAWEVTGDGDPVVMLHGLGGSSNSFETLMGELLDYRVIRIDLPGAGRSPLRPGLATLEQLMGAVADCLSASGINRAHLVGHSMGTLVCQYLAAAHPSLVQSMTLYGAISEPSVAARAALKERARMAMSGQLVTIADAVAETSLARQSSAASAVARAFVRESIMRQSPEGYAQHCRLLSAAQLARHDAILCPTLLIAGEHDPVAPISMAQQLLSAIKSARLETLSSVGHWMMIEAPADSARLLKLHLDAHAL